MPLKNNWVGYATRTYQQIKDSVLTRSQSLVPEMTDHTESNIFVRMIGIWSALIEMLGYYTDNTAREAHLPTARLYKSGIKIAQMYDYRVHSHVASTGDVTFILNAVSASAVVIPANTEVQNDTGVSYFTSTLLTIPSGDIEGTVGVRQYSSVASTVIGTSDGAADQSFEFSDDVIDGSISIFIASIAWTGSETLGYSLPTATDYVQTVNVDKKATVLFGDGVNGAIPALGEDINATYETTLGELGNTGAYTINTVVSSLTLPLGVSLQVTNRLRTTGGRGLETLDELKRRIPKSTRTLLRAVTDLDFIDIPELKAGVAKAGIDFDCGKGVNVYIVPDGGGVASSVLIADTKAFLEQYRLLLVDINVFSAGEVRLKIVMDLEVLPQYSRTVTDALVKTNLAEFLSFLFQEISGKVFLSDLYEVIENTTGVKNSNIKSVKALPYARILTGTNALNWVRETSDTNMDTTKWKITIVSSTNFEVLRDSSFLGSFTIGTSLTYTDLTLTVLASSYVVGDSWEFYTYPSLIGVSGGSLDIVEPSLPVSLVADISVNATGGV